MDSGLIGGGRRRRKALLLALCKRLHGPQQSATSPKICTDSQLIRLTLLPFNSRILTIRLQRHRMGVALRPSGRSVIT